MSTVVLGTVLTLALCALQASNTTVGVGLGLDRGVLVQEYWRGNTPYYAIANLRKVPIHVRIHEWKNRQPARRLIGPVEIKPNALERVEALPAQGQALVAVVLDDDTVLGLYPRPRTPSAAPADGIATFDGLNGVGGRRPDLWVTQEMPSYPRGQDITLRLTVPDGIGTIHFSREKSMPTLPEAPVVAASSETLPVREGDRGITIDATKAKVSRGSHTIVLRLRTLPDEAAPLVIVNGRITTPQGGGFSITRGVPLSAPGAP